MWLKELRTQRCLCEHACSIPGLAQWVKDLSVAMAQVAPAAPIQPWPANFHVLHVIEEYTSWSSRRGAVVNESD